MELTEILVTRPDLATATHEGSVIVLTGTDQVTSARVTFAGDARLMVDLIDGVAADGEASASVESWQILSVTS
jgi:hypothetical protein